jgi:hypothetical protein
MAMCILFSGDVFQVSSAKVMNIPEKCKQILFFFLLYALYQLHFYCTNTRAMLQIGGAQPKIFTEISQTPLQGL